MGCLLNLYRCPACGETWEDVWCCACDSECPKCGLKDLSPYESDDAEDGDCRDAGCDPDEE